MQVSGGGRFPAQADATAEEAADGAVRLICLAGAGGAGDQQRRAFGDTGSTGAGASSSGDLVSPGGDLRLVGQGPAIAGGDTGVRQLEGRDRLRRRFLGCDTRVDAAAGQDAVEPVGERADPVGLAGEGGGQRSPPKAASTSVGFVHALWTTGAVGVVGGAFMASWTRLGRVLGCNPLVRCRSSPARMWVGAMPSSTSLRTSRPRWPRTSLGGRWAQAAGYSAMSCWAEMVPGAGRSRPPKGYLLDP